MSSSGNLEGFLKTDRKPQIRKKGKKNTTKEKKSTMQPKNRKQEWEGQSF